MASVELEITTQPQVNLPWPGFANVTEVAGYAGSEECFVGIESWINECEKEHEACRVKGKGRSVELPKRLIDTGPIGEESSPRVVVSRELDKSDEGIRYCALSYCWGDSKNNFTTTAATYHGRGAGFEFNELPRTFQDAFIVARRMRCRYIWVSDRVIRAHSD